jgi:hypothetical protein
MDISKYSDLVARAGWTGAEGALSVLIVGLADVKIWWAVPLMVALSAAKTFVVNKRKAAA